MATAPSYYDFISGDTSNRHREDWTDRGMFSVSLAHADMRRVDPAHLGEFPAPRDSHRGRHMSPQGRHSPLGRHMSSDQSNELRKSFDGTSFDGQSQFGTAANSVAAVYEVESSCIHSARITCTRCARAKALMQSRQEQVKEPPPEPKPPPPKPQEGLDRYSVETVEQEYVPPKHVNDKLPFFGLELCTGDLLFGAAITWIEPGSVAEKSGLVSLGDVVMTVNGHETTGRSKRAIEELFNCTVVQMCMQNRSLVTLSKLIEYVVPGTVKEIRRTVEWREQPTQSHDSNAAYLRDLNQGQFSARSYTGSHEDDAVSRTTEPEMQILNSTIPAASREGYLAITVLEVRNLPEEEVQGPDLGCRVVSSGQAIKVAPTRYAVNAKYNRTVLIPVYPMADKVELQLYRVTKERLRGYVKGINKQGDSKRPQEAAVATATLEKEALVASSKAKGQPLLALKNLYGRHPDGSSALIKGVEASECAQVVAEVEYVDAHEYMHLRQWMAQRKARTSKPAA